MACGVKPVWLNAGVSLVGTFISEKLSFAFCRRTLYRSQLSEARWATPEATCNSVKVPRFTGLRSMLVAATGGYRIRLGAAAVALVGVCAHQPNLYPLASARLFWFIDNLNPVNGGARRRRRSTCS